MVTLALATALVIATGVLHMRDAARGSALRRPVNDAELVARVPARRGGSEAAERDRLRRDLGASPLDLPAAARLARLDIDAARANADPRFLGRAEAALAPWWADASAPPEVLLLRATIRQARHEFSPALDDLDRLTRVAPRDPQAWLTRAVVLGVGARYADALASCEPLAALASAFVVAACRAPPLGLSGRAAEGAEALAAALGGAASSAEAAWGRSLLADLALWSGDARGAESLLRSALALAPDDRYTRAALADRLLDAGRLDEVAALTQGYEQDDALLLRRALGRAAAGASRDDPAIATMAARFEASRWRGDRVHRREESRFVLAIERDPATALRLAIENWQIQREPADARVLLEAALAGGDRAAARPALDWLAATRLPWPHLTGLAAALGSAS